MKFSRGKYSAIYIATQRYIVVLRYAMIKVAEEGCIVLLKGGGRGAYRRAYSRSFIPRCKETEFNNRRNVFANNESLKLLSTNS